MKLLKHKAYRFDCWRSDSDSICMELAADCWLSSEACY